METEKWKLGNW